MNAPVVASKYESLAIIGKGGMATVYVGRARGAAGFQRLVAIKQAHTHVRDHSTVATGLRREASLMAHLDHPNVVRVLDVVDGPDDLVLVLDYVEGGTLTDLLAHPTSAVMADPRGRVRAVVRILLDVAAGLEAAHRAVDGQGRRLGIVHRDVSPSNVLVGADGIARLTDFGIAKTLGEGGDRTETGQLKGKFAYMAPEYVEHQRADAAGDQFSLAVVAWEALSRERLFRGATEFETMKRVVGAEVPPLAGGDPRFAALDHAVRRALSRNTADRWASVRDFADALEAAAREHDLVASHREVGQLVEHALARELEARRHLLRTAPPMIGEHELSVSGISRVVPVGTRRGAPAPLPADGATDARRRKRRRTALVVGLACLVASAAAVAATRSWKQSPPTPEAAPVVTPGGDNDPPRATGASAEDRAPDEAPATIELPDIDEAPPATANGNTPAKGRRAPSRPVRRGAPTPASTSALVPSKAPPNPYAAP